MCATLCFSFFFVLHSLACSIQCNKELCQIITLTYFTATFNTACKDETIGVKPVLGKKPQSLCQHCFKCDQQKLVLEKLILWTC